MTVFWLPASHMVSWVKTRCGFWALSNVNYPPPIINKMMKPHWTTRKYFFPKTWWMNWQVGNRWQVHLLGFQMEEGHPSILQNSSNTRCPSLGQTFLERRTEWRCLSLPLGATFQKCPIKWFQAVASEIINFQRQWKLQSQGVTEAKHIKNMFLEQKSIIPDTREHMVCFKHVSFCHRTEHTVFLFGCKSDWFHWENCL